MILKKINNKHIEEYLQNNSDFFIKNPSLLDKLEFPSASKEKTSKIVSFKDWIIGNLKNKVLPEPIIDYEGLVELNKNWTANILWDFKIEK